MLMPLLSDISNASEIYVSLLLAMTAYPQNISSLVLVLNTSIYIFIYFSIQCFVFHTLLINVQIHGCIFLVILL